jgi:translation initiation factor IF-2
LSTENPNQYYTHKGVGAITETDVMLASASDAIIIDLMCVRQVMQDSLLIKKN